MSVEFQWSEAEMDALLASCEREEVTELIHRYVPIGSRVLEAGCGAGRYVKFLTSQGYEIEGLELSAQTVKMVNGAWPELTVVQGDVLSMPYPDNTFDAIMSLGVVEHFIPGPRAPLVEMLRALKPGGIAVVTVPCNNTVRRVKRALWIREMSSLRVSVRGIVRRGPVLPNRLDRKYIYPVDPAVGTFFEYWMTPNQFAEEVTAAGFEIIEQLPTAIMDGVYHELNPWKSLVRFADWQFQATNFAERLNDALAKHPFAHSHMQAIVARKPDMH